MVKDNGNPMRALRSINDTLLMYRFLYPPKKKKFELLNLLFLFKFDWPTYFFRWLHVVFDGGIYRHPKSRAKIASIFSLSVVRFVWFVPWLSVSNLLETLPMDPVRNNFFIINWKLYGIQTKQFYFYIVNWANDRIAFACRCRLVLTWRWISGHMNCSGMVNGFAYIFPFIVS